VPNFSAGRPSLTYASALQDANTTAVLPPKPHPIEFESNPDAIALQSAISILQIQRQRAIADMQRLKQARDAAMADPAGFVEDLQAGRVTKAPDPVLGAAKLRGDEDEAEDEENSVEESSEDESASKPWHNLPQPQNVVRMPPVNFDKYGVVGEALDKLHAEQLRRPPTGGPVPIGTDGTYSSKGGTPVPGKEYLGIAAPYNPLKDKVDKKSKKSK
jgi:hypothetical protein